MKKIMGISISLNLIMMFLAAFFLTTSVVVGQDVSCLSQLYPCLNYLHWTQQPPATCCEPLTDLVMSNEKCLCNLISNQGASVAQLIGFNMTAVRDLPGKCGRNLNPVACLSSPPPFFGSSDQSFSAGYTYRAPITAVATTVLLQMIGWFMLK